MNFQRLDTDIWKSLSSVSASGIGYKGIWLSIDDESESTIHIFKDEFGDFHLAIEVNEFTDQSNVIDPKVNGLSVNLSSYLLGGKNLRRFLDIRCNINSYLPEFTKVVKDICAAILHDNKTPLVAVNEIINKWIVFWDNKISRILSEEEIVGLLCELTVLRAIVTKNPEKVINGWVGPFKERHDFMFDTTSIEVKGTRSGSRTHTINGIDQLLPFPGKELFFISFLVSRSENANSISLPIAINELYIKIQDYPSLIIRLNELLSSTGYSPLNSDDYDSYRFLVSDAQCYRVNNKFPFLTRHSITSPLIERISSIRYNITLEGIHGVSLDKIRWDLILKD